MGDNFIIISKQLETKMTSIKEILIQLGRDIQRENPALGPWLGSQRKKWNGLPCELWPIRKSPQLNNYRNKCEFSIGQYIQVPIVKIGRWLFFKLISRSIYRKKCCNRRENCRFQTFQLCKRFHWSWACRQLTSYSWPYEGCS